MKRRTFIKGAVASAGLITLFSAIANAEERRRGGAPAAAGAATLVDPKDPAAKAVNYVHKNSEIKDKALTVERTGVKFKDQKCSNCSFYQKEKESTVAGKKAAPCLMPFANGKAVAADGWCTSWAKKA